MKKIVLLLSLSIFASQFCANGYAAEADQDLINQLQVPNFSVNMSPVPLQPKERKALELSKKWITKSSVPFMAANGKLTYVHGASMPTVLATPMQVCDVELQQGESINSINVGDTARWQVVVANANNREHILVKPSDSNIETNAIVATNRRVYHLRLVSTEDSFTPYIGFVYANEMLAYQNSVNEQKAKKEHFNSYSSEEVEENKTISLENLNFNYELRGSASWKPERVYDDGTKTYIKLPKRTYTSEMPILLVSKGGETVLVNYRTQKTAMIVDGVFDEIILVLGVGKNKEQINIVRAN